MDTICESRYAPWAIPILLLHGKVANSKRCIGSPAFTPRGIIYNSLCGRRSDISTYCTKRGRHWRSIRNQEQMFRRVCVTCTRVFTAKELSSDMPGISMSLEEYVWRVGWEPQQLFIPEVRTLLQQKLEYEITHPKQVKRSCLTCGTSYWRPSFHPGNRQNKGDARCSEVCWIDGHPEYVDELTLLIRQRTDGRIGVDLIDDVVQETLLVCLGQFPDPVWVKATVDQIIVGMKRDFPLYGVSLDQERSKEREHGFTLYDTVVAKPDQSIGSCSRCDNFRELDGGLCVTCFERTSAEINTPSLPNALAAPQYRKARKPSKSRASKPGNVEGTEEDFHQHRPDYVQLISKGQSAPVPEVIPTGGK